jgi:hypothetical protein
MKHNNTLNFDSSFNVTVHPELISAATAVLDGTHQSFNAIDS